LEPGDVITLYTDETQAYEYIVEDKFIVKDKGEPEAVRRENAKWIGPFNEERLTLVTCWPYTSNTHRLIVIAKPVKTS
jgi:sortase A